MNIRYYENAYFFVALFFLLLFLLLGLRSFLKNGYRSKKVAIGNAQILGRREEQEDSFSTTITETGVLAVLADGMGGFEKGKMASSNAVSTFVSEFSKASVFAEANSLHSIEDFFIKTAALCNREILKKARGIKTGTTLVAVILSQEKLYWASSGDSAIFLFRKGEFINLNKKHIFQDVLEEQYLSGKISREEVLNNPMKKRLTCYIGHEEFKNIEICKEAIKLRRGDKIILCSDGVYNSISEIEMEKILVKNKTADKASEEIIDSIKKKKYTKQDNATIIILEKNK